MMTQRLLVSAFASLAALGACSGSGSVTIEPNPGASLTVVNDSDFTITEIFLTEVDNPSWGSNLLRGDVLYPDESFSLGVPCDFYDALLVDETDVECEVHDIDLCLNAATWVIRNNTCAVFELEAKRRDEAAKAAASAGSASTNL